MPLDEAPVVTCDITESSTIKNNIRYILFFKLDDMHNVISDISVVRADPGLWLTVKCSHTLFASESRPPLICFDCNQSKRRNTHRPKHFTR